MQSLCSNDLSCKWACRFDDCWCCRIDSAQAYAGLVGQLPESQRQDTSDYDTTVFSKVGKLCAKVSNENWFGERCGRPDDYHCVCNLAKTEQFANLVDKSTTAEKEKSKSSGATKCHRSRELLTAIVIIVIVRLSVK